ncbi:hypothetical protein SAZ11_31145 [Streptomyces sp. FXJ1.4098]|uniref:hypothetical protein n=1 Tax=Streptomyces sp. NPDC020845 TaxID=3365096 RepID=UPI00299139CC|nr:hypothetical protein [Streptomyces sp. FXJ1.4098]
MLEILPDPTVVPDKEAHRLRDRTSWAIRSVLAMAWQRYDTDRYADEIIAHLDERELDFPVSNLQEPHDADVTGVPEGVQVIVTRP